MSKAMRIVGSVAFWVAVGVIAVWNGPARAGCIPVAEIVNNGIDEDCDGVDSCYQDLDNDNWGTPTVIDSNDLDCADNLEAGVTGDCNDGNAAVHPGAAEIVGNSNDEDCNGQERCYQDNDHDTYGSSTVINSADVDCLDIGEANDQLDCNDGNSNAFPGAVEIVGDSIDEDCNGQERCYQDNDHDTYGSSTVITSSDLDCLDIGEANDSLDCNDANSNAFPGAVEIVGDNIDEDCNGIERCYQDNDNDDYGTSTVINSTDADCLDAFEATNTTDCNDGNVAIYPGAAEVCNAQDDDCDTLVDEFPAPGAVASLDVTKTPSIATIAWPAVPSATAYDVVVGRLLLLAGSNGNFTVATTSCLANDNGSISVSDPTIPPIGDGFWYLVRAVTCATHGTYDSGALSQVGLRDPEIAASPSRCLP